MENSILVWKLFLLLLPGVITTLFIRYITTNKDYTPFYFIIYSAILGLSTFLLLEIIISIFNIIKNLFCGNLNLTWKLNLSIWDVLIESDSNIKKSELLFAYFTAIPFGLIVGYLIQHKTLYLFLRKIGLTSRSNDGDVWSHFLYMPDVKWIIVRDKQSNLAYFGEVLVFSEANEKREILLGDVDVYTSDSWKKLYYSRTVLLELNEEQYSMELPQIINKEEKNEKIRKTK